jgi:hypothetical protein
MSVASALPRLAQLAALSLAVAGCTGDLGGEGPTSGPGAGTGAHGAGSGAAGAAGSGTPGSGGGASASSGSGGSDFPPGPPGCGLPEAAFCETFDAPAAKTGRAGELDATRFSAARMCNIGGPSWDDEAVAIGPATVPPCRAGLPAQAFPSSDALICDGTAEVQSAHAMVLVAAQNYGQNSYRIRQPFDFTGRTGTIVFDAEGDNIGLQGWISVEVTEDPTPGPSFTLQENWENGAIPRNAVEVQLAHNCGADHVGISDLLVYEDFHQTAVFSAGPDCAPAVPGRLNHFEVRISTDHIEVWATPASANGLDFEPAVLIGAADISLPFSRGYVHLTTHNHASLKYSDNTVDAWVARWDNVGFDGPAITSGWREYEAPDALTTTTTGKVNIAYRLGDAASGPAQTIEIEGVDTSGVTGARLALENWTLHMDGSPPLSELALNYRLNGKAWKARKLTASELQMAIDLPNAGTRSLMLDVDVGDLVDGTNTLELTTSNAGPQLAPVAHNIDLVLTTD